jgi:hypothetical protein
MTRARALKTAIRTRAAKTGERYTTARRHVLAAASLASTVASVSTGASSAPPPAPPKPTPAAGAKGGVSDAKTREKTGHGLDHWFEVLDGFGAVEKGHTAAARHLHDDLGVDGWYAQGITVAYERARNVRAVNQRCDGQFEVSASKTMAGNTAAIVKALVDARLRRRWASEVDPGLVKALSAALSAKTSNGFVIRPDGQGRFRYKWDGSTVQWYLYPKSGDKVSVVVQHTGLGSAAAVDEHRTKWKQALQALAARVGRR